MSRGAAETPPASRRRTLLVAAVAFLALGGLVSLYGPLFPVIRERFGVGVDQVGALTTAPTSSTPTPKRSRMTGKSGP